MECVKNAMRKLFNSLRTPKYKVINEPKSYAGAFRVARLGDIVSTQEKSFMGGNIDRSVSGKNGGIIVFSNEVDDMVLAVALSNWIDPYMRTGNVATQNGFVGWRLVNYLEGSYRARGKVFSENSLSLELVGIEENALIGIAEKICAEFNQKCVLVKDLNSGKIYLV